MTAKSAGIPSNLSGEYPLLRSLASSPPRGYFYNRTGNRLAYDEYGSKTGMPLFYFHDTGSSRLEAVFFHRAARQHGYRLIAVDRPGVGCSDFYESTQTVDFCQDVLTLADELGIGNFAVMSFGAGGVYATTLAYMRPQRVIAHLNLAGVPGNVFNETPKSTFAALCIHELTPALIKLSVRLRHAFAQDKPEASLERLYNFLSYTDRKIMSSPRVRQTLALDQSEAIRNGARGVAQDFAMCFRKLDFKLHEVSVPTLVWQGSADRLSSRSDCEYLVARLQNARFFRVANRGHFFFINCMDEVFGRFRMSADVGEHLAA